MKDIENEVVYQAITSRGVVAMEFGSEQLMRNWINNHPYPNYAMSLTMTKVTYVRTVEVIHD